MVRYDFRHGPRVATKPTTDHRSAPNVHKHAVSKAGWCQICAIDRRDTPGTDTAWWQEGKEVFEIAVCDEHKTDSRLAHPDW